MDVSLKKYIRRDQLRPICEINSNDRDHLFEHASVRQLEPHTLVTADDDTLTYLLEGEVSLLSGGFEVEKFNHNDERALSLLFNPALDEDSALATSHGAILEIDRELFEGLYSQQQASLIETSDSTLEDDESVGISALAYVFTLHRAEHLDPEQSLLAGLVQNLGLIPILKFIDEHPGLIKKAETLEKSMSNLRMPISALLFEQWNFDSDFLQVVEHAENWNRDTGKPADYADLVIASRLLYLHRAGQLDGNIVLNQLPVMKKLNLLDIDNSDMFFFEQAQQEIDDMQKLLHT